MTVITVREELIAWYERRGYARTGELLPFPYSDEGSNFHCATTRVCGAGKELEPLG